MPLDAKSRFQTAKNIGMGLAFLFAVIILPLLYIYGLVWFSEKALPWLFLASAIVFAICLLVLLPLSVFRKLRPWTGWGLYFASFLFGTMLFTFSYLVVVELWGVFALVVGLILAGVGVVPVALLAAVFHREWALLGFVVLGIVVTYGTRAVGMGLAESTPDDESEWAKRVRDGDLAALNSEADELADEDELEEAIESQPVSYGPCPFCEGKGTKEASGQTCEVCEGSGQMPIYEEKN
jgi:hypothetical protein